MSRQFPVLRGLAIIFVLLHHSVRMSYWMAERYSYALPEPWVNAVLVTLRTLGVFAVPIFLFISGAFFAFAAQNRPLRGAYRAVLHNIQTIVWPYVLWSAVFYVAVYLLLGEQYDALGYLKNLVVGYPYNFVPMLLLFYLLAPLLVIAARRWPVYLMAACIVYQAFLLNLEIPGILGVAWPDWAIYLSPPVVRETLGFWLVYFPMGIVFHLHSRAVTAGVKKYAPALIALVVVLSALTELTELRIIDVPQAWHLLAFAGMTLVPIIRRDMFPFYRWIENVGKRSYPLYLTNLVVITAMLFAVRQVFPWLLTHYLLLTPVLFAAALMLPWGLMTLVERIQPRAVYTYVFG